MMLIVSKQREAQLLLIGIMRNPDPILNKGFSACAL
jgi:hypothetical protein